MMNNNSIINKITKIELLYFVCILSSVKIIFGGYSFGRSDLTVHLIPIFRLLDESFIINDFVANGSITFGATFYFVRIMAFLGQYFPLKFVFLFGAFFTNALTAWIAYFTSRDFFKTSEFSAMLCTIIILTIDPFNLGGGGWLTDSYLKPASLVRPFSYVALYYAMKHKPYISMLFICIASIAHPTIGLEIGVFSFIILGADILWSHLNKEKFNIILFVKSLYPLLFPSLIFIFIYFILFVSPYLSSTSLTNKQFMEILLFRAYSDLVPSTFYYKGYLDAIIFTIMLIIGLSWWDVNMDNKKVIFKIKIIALSVLLFCFGGYIFVELIPSRLWAIAMTFRMLFILKWFGIMVIITAVMNSLANKVHNHPLRIIWQQLLLGIRKSFPKWISERVIQTVLFFIVLYILLPFLHKYTIGQGIPGKGLPIFCAITFIFWIRFINNSIVRYLFPFLAVLIISLDIHYSFFPSPINKISKIYPEIDLTLDIYDAGGKEISEYALKNTDPEAVFIVPPEFGGFRLAAKRAIVVDRKCMYSSDDGFLKWWQRINDCYGELPSDASIAIQRAQVYKNYKLITDERLMKISNKYNAKYAVLFSETISSLDVVYEDNIYKIVILHQL